MRRTFRSPPSNIFAALILGWALVFTGRKALRQGHQLIIYDGME